jgi:FlaA1/EpsC-like NDP-sugar epimerase
VRIQPIFYVNASENQRMKPMRRVLICGAGEAGSMVLKEILKHPEERIEVVGFIDDDPGKAGVSIHGKIVLGGRSKLSECIELYMIREVIIAMPSIPKGVIKDIVRICTAKKVKLLIVPSTMEIIEGVVHFDQIKKLDLSDLLEREEVSIDAEEIRRYIGGKKILISGAAGSIGSQLIRDLAEYSPHILVAVDVNENGLFYLSRDVKEFIHEETGFIPCVADIKNSRIVHEIFSRYRPDIVFHAAAYKHVPLMESHERMIFLNNVVGTRTMLEVSHNSGIEKFIGISTDKAVRPVSAMGKTKRICELMTGIFSGNGMESCSVRFGNVLGSNGSVSTVFQEQIARGSPVTITSPYMERYFMTVREATSLVMQAATNGKAGNIYVLDMGRPIKIKDLAENLIILSGLIPYEDIPILYTGIRAGEKYSEELYHRDVEVLPSPSPGIFVEKNVVRNPLLMKMIDELTEHIYELTEQEIGGYMGAIVDEGHSSLLKICCNVSKNC